VATVLTPVAFGGGLLLALVVRGHLAPDVRENALPLFAALWAVATAAGAIAAFLGVRCVRTSRIDQLSYWAGLGGVVFGSLTLLVNLGTFLYALTIG
jgi:hypothetical protein